MNDQIKMTELICGNCLDVLKTLPAKSVHCCVTSPPYYGLRDYGVEGQLGLEKTPEEYVYALVDVFREVWRVLRGDGTLWLNLGDCYKQKNLLGIPWHVAFSLQSDGWYLRQDIVWNKPNAMPESVKDRCVKSHEYVFLLSKSERYFFDYNAIKEPAVGGNSGAAASFKRPAGNKRNQAIPGQSAGTHRPGREDVAYNAETRNRRSVWTVATKPYKEAHFATFPPALVEPCVLAGCPSGGVVLDPFMGSGTAGAVAIQHGRRFVGIELNPAYIELAKTRITQEEARDMQSLIHIDLFYGKSTE